MRFRAFGRAALVAWVVAPFLAGTSLPAAAPSTPHSPRTIALGKPKTPFALEGAALVEVVLGASGVTAASVAALVAMRRSRQSQHDLRNQICEVPGLREDHEHAALAREIDLLGDRLRDSQRELEHARQLAENGKLAAELAHEIRNALTPLKTLIHAALVGGESLVEADLAIMSREVARLEISAQRFLDLSRPLRLEKSLFDARELAREALQLVSGRAAQQHVQGQCAVPDRPVIIEADRDQLAQVLLNLLLNSLDAMPDGGDLTLRLTADPGPVAGFPAERVTLAVEDSGCGLPAQGDEHLFEPFVTYKPTGTGLGLSICRRIVTAHGGAIRGQNRAAGGTVFTVDLPGRAPLALNQYAAFRRNQSPL